MKFPIRIKRYNAKRIYGKDTLLYIVLGISLGFSILLFLLGFFSFIGINFFNPRMISGMDFIVFGLLSAIGPIGFYNHIKSNRKKRVEEQLPDFLREVSSSTSSGMTVFDAIKES